MHRQNLLADENISQFKKPVVKELKEYKAAVESRIFIEIDESRIVAYRNVMENFDSHDLVFLATALEEALDIHDASSKFRDKVGKAAASQLYRYLASVMELLELVAVLGCLYNHNNQGACQSIALCFLTDQLEKHLQYALKNKKLFNGLADGLDVIYRTKFSDALRTTLLSLSLKRVVESTDSVSNNICHLVQSNANFFKQKISENVQALCHGAKTAVRRYF